MWEESPPKRVRLSPDLKLTECFDSDASNTVTLILRNNEELVVERTVLSHYSTYFRLLFSSDFRDSKANVHRCRLVHRSDLHLLLTIPRAFERGIKPHLDIQRAIELLEPAAYLQMDTVLDYVSDIICANLTHDNIIKIFRLSLIYHTPLAFRVWRTMVRLFQTMVHTTVYLSLNESELIGLLTDKHLNIKSSDEKLVVVNWIKHNSPLESDRILQFAQRNFARRPQPDGANYEVIRTRQPASAVVSFGGWASRGIAQHIEVFNSRSDRWQICQFDYDVPDIRRAYNGIQLIDDKLIIFGGFNGQTQFQTTMLFDLRAKKWSNGMNMHEKRCYVTGTTVDESDGRCLVYACGGMNGVSRLKSAEVYDHVANVWTEIADMKHLRSDGATITMNGRVVCVGGFDGRNVHSNGEVYDPMVDMWHPLSSTMKTRRTGCTAVSIMENVCMVLGGFNGIKRLDSSEMYDMREGIWHPVSPMHTGRSNFGACRTSNYSIYVAGGFDGQATTKDNERFDMRNRKWQALTDMNEPKSALRLIQLTDHPFLDDLFQTPDDPGIVTTW